MAVADQQHPRKLVASNAYVKLLSDRDDANRVAEAVAMLTPAQILEGTTGTGTFQFKFGNTTLTSAVFAKYVVQYVIKNAKTIAPEVMDLITADILAQKTEAEMEMGLNGLSVQPIIPAGPVIKSSLTPTDAVTTQAWTYQIMADNISGPGINSCVYAISNAPSWLNVNANTGLVQGVAQIADIGQNTFDITVTTNVASDTQTITVNVEPHAKPIITPGQSTTGHQGIQLTYNILSQYSTVGANGVTNVEWEAPTLPAGLVINPNTGVVTGTPAAAANTTVPVTLTNNFGSVTEDVVFDISV